MYNTFVYFGTGLFTIGIPTARRPNADEIYLFTTLDALINTTSEEEKSEVSVVVLITDLNDTYVEEISSALASNYSEHIETGFISVLRTCACIYPDLDDVKKTFKDPKDRLIWRAKQNIDFAFLMLYSRSLSRYYIQIEDDVVAASDFVSDLKTFIGSAPSPWFLLECSKLGFIGKIFKSEDLKGMAMYLLEKYDEMPCDLLLGKYRGLRGQSKPIHSDYSLFQHIGRFSSLRNKLMPSIDKTFKNLKLNGSLGLPDLPKGDNPPAEVETSMTQYLDFEKSYAYDNNGTTYFWGKSPLPKDHFTLIFHKPQNISRILIISGDENERKDKFINTALDFAQYNASVANSVNSSCSEFKTMTDLVDGDLDTRAMGTVIPPNIKCLRIRVKKKVKTWIVIRDIRVFT